MSIAPADVAFFESRIRPVLVEQCYSCHSKGADKVRGGLLLDSRAGVLQGGNGGKIIVPGEPEQSLLFRVISHLEEDLDMPRNADKLSDRQIADFAEWIRRGAPDPRESGAGGYGGVGRAHWSFQPVTKPAVPAVKNGSWPKTPVDHFILARLEGEGLAPNPAADRRTLIRRTTFDLTGLPPTEKEVEAFLADGSPEAFAKVVDRLLASPQYGERWGRYWLDVARYADTKGDPPRQEDPRFPHAWTYRDYVIDAFNKDKPYTDFIVEQLAADRLAGLPPAPGAGQEPDARGRAGQAQRPLAAGRGARGAGAGPMPATVDPSLAALGFLTLGNTFDGNVRDIINDRIDVTTKAFLGLTVSCARCHDHKFDPIPTRDYYSLYGVFANTAAPANVWDLPEVAVPAGRAVRAEQDSAPTRSLSDKEAYLAGVEKLKADQAALAADQAGARRGGPAITAEMRRALQQRATQLQQAIAQLELTHPGAPARANVIRDVANPRDYPVLLRGEAQMRGEVVPRRFLEILSPDPKNRTAWTAGSGRLELARAIASPANPLTARVLVNRVWQQHFGEGFVATPDDLGNMSSPPTHPELLDYLAVRFMEDGWSVKKLHRLILLSAVYQESAAVDARSAARDPDNKLHWRFTPRRLDFEQLHDSLLALSGDLDLTRGGKPVRIESADFARRRAVYAFIDRSNPAEILTQFDFPNPSVPSGRRYLTIVPQQSLFLMNGALVIETARKLTQRPEFLALGSPADRVRFLYLAVFQRPPSAQETAAAVRYVSNNPLGNEAAFTAQSSRAAQQQMKQAERAAANPRGRNQFQGEPGAAAFGTRTPLDAWGKLAHALFQTTEAMFYD